jgi:hypothetical protein
VAQIQTGEKFIPHLASGSENIKRGALIAIAALGNEELAVKLATAFGGSGATAGLASIASTASPHGVASAARALKDIFRDLRERIVAIADERGDLVGDGLLVGNGNWIVTVRFVVEAATARQMGSGAYISGCHLHVGLSEGEQLIAKESGTSKDLVLLEIDSKTKVPNREILEPTAGVGDRVLALLRGQHGERRLEVGSFVSVTEGGDLGEGRVLEPGGRDQRERVVELKSLVDQERLSRLDDRTAIVAPRGPWQRALHEARWSLSTSGDRLPTLVLALVEDVFRVRKRWRPPAFAEHRVPVGMIEMQMRAKDMRSVL